MAADAQRVADLEAGLDVGHRLVVVARDVAARDQKTRLARLARLKPDHHGAHIGVALAHLHGEVGDVGGARHALHAAHGAVGVVAQAGRLGVGTLRVFLHHPQVGAAVVEQHVRVVDHATVDAGHRQRHADQQAQAEAREHKLGPRMQDVAAGQADHGWRPASDSTTLMRVPALSSFSL
jgi:hypothetical protein